MLDVWKLAAVLAFGSAVVAYGFVAVLIATSGKGRSTTRVFLSAALSGCAWSAFSGYAMVTASPAILFVPVADSLLISIWVSCFAPMIGTTRPVRAGGVRLSVLAISVVWALTGLVAAAQSLLLFSAGGGAWLSVSSLSLLFEALVGLLLVEQIYRNSAMRQRAVWFPLAIAVGAMFAANVFVYTQAVLYGGLHYVSEVIRGAVIAISAPAILVAIKRQPEWESQLFVSRHIVFYTATLSAAGVYLILVSLIAYLIGSSGESWGTGAQLAFLLFALLVLASAIFSSELRSRVKVFIAKHFYRNKFDYRVEWINLIRTLVDSRAGLSPAERGIHALANILGSGAGQLWMRDSATGEFVGSAAWNADKPIRQLDARGSLVSFLSRQRWVVDTVEVLEDPEKYSNAFNEDSELGDEPSIYVPLVMDDKLIGIVRLARPGRLSKLDYEDHDLLKTAGQQVAIYILQEQAKEELSRARQFEAFSKLTTFLMHDLKNIVSQQQLVVTNAKKFGDRPEFVADAFRTIEAGVQRMRAVLARLRENAGRENVSLVLLDRILGDACDATADRAPVPRVSGFVGDAAVYGDRERLTAALVHAIRNSQDAAREGGHIDIACSVEGQMALIVVRDDGVGMSKEFLETRLFRPFDSTKGAQGMGIGAYQIREAVTGAGGTVSVSSHEGSGTTLEVRLPLAAQRRTPVAGADRPASGSA